MSTAAQLYRYDSGEHVVECVSCASSFDPEPRLSAFLNGGDGKPLINGAMPLDVSVAGNGDYAFFTTPAALVPEDIDGEIPIAGRKRKVNMRISVRLRRRRAIFMSGARMAWTAARSSTVAWR